MVNKTSKISEWFEKGVELTLGEKGAKVGGGKEISVGVEPVRLQQVIVLTQTLLLPYD